MHSKLSSLQLGEARQLDISFSNTRAAFDIATAVLSNLLLNRNSIEDVPSYFAQLFRGAFTIVNRVAAGKTTSGKVPIPVFQLLSCLRPRRVLLTGMDSVYVRCTPVPSAGGTGFPTGTPTDEDVVEFLQACRMLKANCDLSQIEVEVMKLNGLGSFQLCHTLGPLTSLTQTDNKTCMYMHLREDLRPGASWMRYMGWATAFNGIIPDFQSDLPLFYLLDDPHLYPLVTPGSVILTRCIRDVRIMSAKHFSFPTIAPSLVDGFLRADAEARGLDLAPPGAGSGEAYAEFGAGIALARLGIENGFLDYTNSFLAQKSYMLPSSVVEALVMNVLFQDGDVQIPVPVEPIYTLGDSTTTNASYIYSKSYSGVNSCFCNMANTYTNIQYGYSCPSTNRTPAGAQMVNLPPGTGFFYSAAWGSDVTINRQTTVYVPSNYFQNTIGRGPLSRPSSDCKVGKINFTEVSCDVGTKDSVFKTKHYRSINFKKNIFLSDESLSLLASFPLSFDGIPPVISGGFKTFSFSDKYFHRLLVRGGDMALEAVPNTVVEAGSAKFTDVQRFIETLATTGNGGDSLFGYIAKSAKRGGRVLKGMGVPFAGAIEVVGDVAEFLLGDERQNRRTAGPRPNRRPEGGPPRSAKPKRKTASRKGVNRRKGRAGPRTRR